MLFYGNADNTRERANNVLTNEFPDTEVEEELISFSRFVYNKTHKTWTIADEEKALIDKIVIILASCEIVHHYSGTAVKDYCKDQREYAMKLLPSISYNSLDVDIDKDTGEMISHDDYNAK